jgi:hypothetical protein
MLNPTRDQKDRMLKRIIKYFEPLIERGFSGKVTTRFDRGHLQEYISRDETDKLEDVSA